MDDVKLNEQEILKIDELHKSIVDNGKLGNDILMLLFDGVQSLKSNLFYSSIATFTIFLEKYLRDTLIWYEYTVNNKKTDEESFMKLLEQIEEQIEDGKENGKKYMFDKICNKLVEYGKINESISLELKNIYDNIRIPVQHGIYARIIKKQIGNGFFPIKKIQISDNISPEELLRAIESGASGPYNDTMNIYNPIARMFVLPGFFKDKSIEMLVIIDNLIKIIQSNKI